MRPMRLGDAFAAQQASAKRQGRIDEKYTPEY